MKRTPLKRRSPTRRATRPKVKQKPKKTIEYLKKKLWVLCREITRKRHGYNCFTCGRLIEAPHTGHFIPSSVCSVEMRYSLDNLRPQCHHCNINLSGNWIEYEKRLPFPNILKMENEATKGRQYDSLWYEAKIEEYQNLLETL